MPSANLCSEINVSRVPTIRADGCPGELSGFFSSAFRKEVCQVGLDLADRLLSGTLLQLRIICQAIVARVLGIAPFAGL